MGIELPDLGEGEFRRRLSSAFSGDLVPGTRWKLYQHYRELRRWNRRVALVGRGVADAVVERLFGESLAALPLLGSSVRRVVDVGSGAGFPGLVIAAALPDTEVYLVEPKQKKWAFLRSAAARASLSCVCLNARVTAALPSGMPESVDRVTVRALRLGAVEIGALGERLTRGGSFLIWTTPERPAPVGLAEGRVVELGPGRGRIQEYLLAGDGTDR